MSSSLHEGMRVSPLRIVVAIVVAAGLAVGGLFGYQTWSAAQAEPADNPWFAGYADVTATPSFTFEKPTADSAKQVLLSFVVSDPAKACTPSWGGYYSLDDAGAKLELDRRIALLREVGGDAGISFGGQRSDELATTCDSATALAAAYGSVIDRYSVSTIDLDLEGAGLTDTAAGKRRAEAVASLQADRPDDDPLAVWVTLPVATSGLTSEGTDAVAALLDAGVDLAGVNVMTMNFGESRDAGQSMAEASEAALEATHRQLSTLYTRAGIPLSDATVWNKLGATPMIGQNDTSDEIFTLDDAAELNSFAQAKGLGRLSMWSLNRDVTCGNNYITLAVVSNSCSGVDQGKKHFADELATGFDGSLLASAQHVTSPEPLSADELTDNPDESPYPVWSKLTTYLEGTKIVWHHNVYQAKWWTSGDLPDNPVLNDWETPWKLIGPVLPGEKPLETQVLTPGLFPQWDGTAIYDKGAIVSFEDVPYRAKWWTQGDSPAAFSTDPDSSPWFPMSIDEVEEATAG